MKSQRKRQKAAKIPRPIQRAVGNTEQWNLRQVVPVYLYSPATQSNTYQIEMVAGVNGWAIKTTDSAFNQVGPVPRNDYGAATGQFARLSNLWNTYQITGVTAKFTPAGTWLNSTLSPAISVVDVVGGNNSGDFATTLGLYNKSKNLMVHEVLKPLSRHVHYTKWLSECVPNPFLQTIASTGSAREYYQVDAISRVPAIHIALQVQPTVSPGALTPMLIGIFDINAMYQFRGRRLDDASVPTLGTANIDKATLPTTSPQSQSIVKPQYFDANGRPVEL